MMTTYTMAVGTHDPYDFAAGSDAEALRRAVGHVEGRYADDLRTTPELVVSLLGPAGLMTRPSERIDEFVRRVPGPHPTLDDATLQPGDANAPDCSGD